jgi:hypothetical protein
MFLDTCWWRGSFLVWYVELVPRTFTHLSVTISKTHRRNSVRGVRTNVTDLAEQTERYKQTWKENPTDCREIYFHCWHFVINRRDSEIWDKNKDYRNGALRPTKFLPITWYFLHVYVCLYCIVFRPICCFTQYLTFSDSMNDINSIIT